MSSSLALPPGSRVLVTGANGYLASHAVNQLLQKNYIVRGTVRAAKPWLDEFFTKQYGQGKYESVIVSSFEDTDSVGRALDGIDGVIHLASDLTFGTDPHTIIPWVIKAMQGILEAAAQKPQIKRMVLCSSSSTTYGPWYPEPNGCVIDENSWNDEAVREAWDDQTPASVKGVTVYAASKTETERKAWEWIKQHKPHFQFNTVVPCFNIGKILHPEIFGSTMGWTLRLLQGDPVAFSMFPEQWWVDVEDAALLCVISLLNPTVNSERVFAFSEQKNWRDVVGIFRELLPQNKQIPDPPEQVPDRTEVKPRARAEELLRASGKDGFTTVRESLEKSLK